MKRAVLFLLTALAFSLHAAPEYPQMGPDIYDAKADGKTQIAAALAKAAPAHKRVLVMFGANWCVWCHRLHHTFETDAKAAGALPSNDEFVLVAVTPRNGETRTADVDPRYGKPTK